MILNALAGDHLPVYGDGKNVRNWLFVEDFARGIGHALKHGAPGEVYNCGGPDECDNLTVVRKIIEQTGRDESLIEFVTDRPGHDRRYSLSSEKLARARVAGAGPVRGGSGADSGVVSRQRLVVGADPLGRLPRVLRAALRAGAEGLNDAGLRELDREVIACRRCPRLVAWREEVARVKRASFASEEYWGRPLPGFGDPEAAVLVVGLAPAAHGGNRTGRIFTGDRSGDWLFGSLYRTGFANQPTSVARDDGLRLTRVLHRCGGPVRATGQQADARRARQLPAVSRARARAARIGSGDRDARVVRVGRDVPSARRSRRVRDPSPSAEVRARRGGLGRADSSLLGCYHPSQQNTFTGKLTEPMIDAVFGRARGARGLALCAAVRNGPRSPKTGVRARYARPGCLSSNSVHARATGSPPRSAARRRPRRRRGRRSRRASTC